MTFTQLKHHQDVVSSNQVQSGLIIKFESNTHFDGADCLSLSLDSAMSAKEAYVGGHKANSL